MDESAPELNPVLTELLNQIAERIPAERRDVVTAFSKAYTRRLSAEELAGADLDQLYGQVTSAYSFTDARGLHPLAVRVFDPKPATDGYETQGTVLETNTDDSPFLVD